MCQNVSNVINDLGVHSPRSVEVLQNSTSFYSQSAKRHIFRWQNSVAKVPHKQKQALRGDIEGDLW